nr:NADH dehydrogenase subunit 4L [Aspidomorpha difformis]
MLNYLLFFFYFSGLVVFIKNLKHFLNILLSLEFLMLTIFFSLYISFSFNLMNIFFLMIFLTMVVCEGVLGLSVMVKMIRLKGSSNMMSFSCLW